MKNTNTAIATMVATAVLLAAVASGAAVAQSDEPGSPVVLYGDAEEADGMPISEGVTVVAAVNGTEVDRITVEEEGIYAGGEADDEKLETDTNAGDEVTFHIESVDGPQAEETWDIDDSGVFRQDLTFPTESFDTLQAADLEIDGESSAIEIEEGTTVGSTVTATFSESGEVVFENSDDVNGDNSVDAVDFDSDESVVSVNDGSFEVTAESVGNTSVDVTVSGDGLTETDSIDIEVVKESTDTGDDSSGGTGGGGGSGGAGTGSDVQPPEPPADVDVETDETVGLVVDDETDTTTATFGEDNTVASVAFDFRASGDINARTLNREPDETGPAPGSSVAVSQITASGSLGDSSATIRKRVARDRLDDIGADTETLRAFRFADGKWQPLDTEVVDETDQHVVVEAETPGFSYFAVSATGEPTAAIDAPSEVEAGTEVTLDASASEDQYGEIVSYDWTVDGESLSGETATTTLDEAGDVSAELTVENDAGETDTASATITVAQIDDSDDTADGDDTDGDDTTDDGIPGFGTVVALVALIAAALLATRADN